MKQQDIPNSRWEIEITSNPLVPTSTRFRPFKESSDAQNSPIESSKSSKLIPTIVENVCSIFDDVYQKIVNTKIGEINGGGGGGGERNEFEKNFRFNWKYFICTSYSSTSNGYERFR